MLAWLRRRGRAANRRGMARYGIVSPRVFGVSMAALRPLAARLGRRRQDLADALWTTGWLEARMLAGLVADPARLGPGAMNAWARDFDNWAIVDGTCLHVFCRSPHAWGRVAVWRQARGEYQRRAAFALLACLAVHDRRAPDTRFREALSWVAAGAADERPYVRKAVNWALRQIGKRSPALRRDAMASARRIAALDTPGARWIAADALAELARPAVAARAAERHRRRRAGR